MQVLCNRDLPDPLHDPGRHDQQKVLKSVCADHRADKHVPPYGTKATEEGRTHPCQQCAQTGVCSAKGEKVFCVLAGDILS